MVVSKALTEILNKSDEITDIVWEDHIRYHPP